MIKKNVLKRLIISLVILILLGLYTQLNDNQHLLYSGTTNSIDEWFYKGNRAEIGEHLYVTKNTPYTLSSQLPVNYSSSDRLLIRSSLSSFEIHMEGDKVFDSNLDYPNRPLASLWHIVELPESSAGKSIDITYQSPYRAMNGIVNPVIYGSSSDIKQSIVLTYGPSLIVDIFILFIGIVLIMVSFINPNSNAWYVGVFAIFVSLWLISESRMLQFITGDQIILASFAFISLALIPIPFLQYLKGILTKSTHKTLDVLTVISMFNIIVIILLQALRIADFYETVIVTHFIIITCIGIIMILLYREIKFKKNDRAKRFSISLSILFGFIALEMARFYISQAAQVTTFVTIGLLIFILNLGYITSKEMIVLYKKSYKAEFYERLAFLDQLTQGPNRTAFERDLEEVFFDPLTNKNLRLAILDMNQLKAINDNYGHIKGDNAIKESFNLIQKNYKHLGKTYRIGGDEFAVVITKGGEKHFDKATNRLLDDIRSIDDLTEYPFSISIGSVLYKDDTSIDQLIHRADVNMYICKRKTHEITS